jgi:DNA-binding transcriptional MerR regulator
MQKKYHIRDLEEITGIKAHTIRMWEKRYKIITPERSDTNIRYYNETTFKRFLLISQLYHSNFKISEIAKLSNDELKEKALLLTHSTEEQDAWQNELITAVFDFNFKNFSEIFRNLIFTYNLEKTFIYIILPFLKKIQTLWFAENITNLHHEFVFNSTNKILMGILCSLNKYNLSNERKFILISENNSINKILLLYAEIILKKLNYESIVFTNNNINENFIKSLESIKSHRIVIPIPLNQQKANEINEIINKFKNYKFYAIDINYMIPEENKNLVLINTLEDFEEEISFSF